MTTTTKEREELARELFTTVHVRLGHSNLREEFDQPSQVHRKVAWIEIARVVEERVVPCGRWLDDYARALYKLVHHRLGDGREDDFDTLNTQYMPYIRIAWREIARVLDERLQATVNGARVLIVGDGERWYVRRVAAVVHDLERDEKVYRCDQHLGGPYDDPAEALVRAKSALVRS